MRNLMIKDPNTNSLLIPNSTNKDRHSRLARFVTWLNATGETWHSLPDLQIYANYLLSDGRADGTGGLAPATVNAHLSTIRSRCQELLYDNRLRDALEATLRMRSSRANQPLSPADIKAILDSKYDRIRNAIIYNRASAEEVKEQYVTDQKHIRLTAEQASFLLTLPGMNDNQGKRDTALLGLMLVTGIRAAEAAALQIPDLRQEFGGELSLHVRHGKGSKARLIPYGGMDWVLILVDRYLETVHITAGPVFRGFYKGYKKVRKTSLTVRAIEDIVGNYPMLIGGTLTSIAPHDLRRTYARMMYQAGMDLVKIQQNMGHEDSKTTLGYIGTLDASDRRPPNVLYFDFSEYDL
jgi:site-specific recombinase XerD